mmetsp:Transcript_89200/g.186418  ORF Transcript_89200/g.186418 Transcript_89200/m.186418 type:complete len:248 (-) Transcript_89200:75-818(-)
MSSAPLPTGANDPKASDTEDMQPGPPPFLASLCGGSSSSRSVWGCGCYRFTGSKSMEYTGPGKGEYVREITYEYVGTGAGEFNKLEPTKRKFPWRFVALVVTLALLIAFLVWLFAGGGLGSLKSLGSGIHLPTGGGGGGGATDGKALVELCSEDFESLNKTQQQRCCVEHNTGCPKCTEHATPGCDAPCTKDEHNGLGPKTYSCRQRASWLVTSREFVPSGNASDAVYLANRECVCQCACLASDITR